MRLFHIDHCMTIPGYTFAVMTSTGLPHNWIDKDYYTSDACDFVLNRNSEYAYDNSPTPGDSLYITNSVGMRTASFRTDYRIRKNINSADYIVVDKENVKSKRMYRVLRGMLYLNHAHKQSMLFMNVTSDVLLYNEVFGKYYSTVPQQVLEIDTWAYIPKYENVWEYMFTTDVDKYKLVDHNNVKLNRSEVTADQLVSLCTLMKGSDTDPQKFKDVTLHLEMLYNSAFKDYPITLYVLLNQYLGCSPYGYRDKKYYYLKNSGGKSVKYILSLYGEQNVNKFSKLKFTDKDAALFRSVFDQLIGRPDNNCTTLSSLLMKLALNNIPFSTYADAYGIICKLRN